MNWKSIEDFARRGEIIVMAGAGVSAGNPSAIPGWKPLNAAIVRALSHRINSALNRHDWLAEVGSMLDTERDADRFPPEYQAQLIEEMCGERYFRGLQALNIDIVNSAHDGIAALAAAGALRAIVTTNFDRLIERALDQRNVSYQVAFDNAGFKEMGERLNEGNRGPLPIIKIHGCVSDHRSMIDTLKQRKLGRSEYLQKCLDPLFPYFWLFLGFSAADLEGDKNYLGLLAGAASSAGAKYVAYPPHPELSKGAQLLMGAYGIRGNVVVADIASYLTELCAAIGAKGPAEIPTDNNHGLNRIQEGLESWANGLSVSSAGLCLAAILEAIGQSEPAVRIMDRMVRKELYNERDTSDFKLLQLHYGRLGAAFGRFIAVPDLNGAASNASVETLQSLLPLLNSETGFAASSYLAPTYLWLNYGDKAMGIALHIMKGFIDGAWDGQTPRNDEEAVDAWTSAALVCILNNHEDTAVLVDGTYKLALDRAIHCGDVVRTARVAALYLFVLAETSNDVPSLSEGFVSTFLEAERVGDGFALGFRLLALGRWYVGNGGMALAQHGSSPADVAQRAIDFLKPAAMYFSNQGMDPWMLFVKLQQAKAYSNMRRYDEAQECINNVNEGIERFPILASYLYEVVGQLQLMTGNDTDAKENFNKAVNAAAESDLLKRHETLLGYMRLFEN